MQELSKTFIEHFIEDIFQDENVKSFLKHSGTSKSELQTEISEFVLTSQGIKKKASVKKEMTIELARELLSGTYDMKWMNNKHNCVICFGISAPENREPYTYCNAPCKRYLCDDHNIKKNEKLLSQLKSGELTLDAYHDSNILRKKNIGKAFLKENGADIESLKRMAESRPLATKNYEFLENHKRDPEYGLVVTPIVEKGQLLRKYKAVGVDKKNDGNIRKLTLRDLKRYEGVNVTIDIDIIEKETLARYNK